ncbi:hypothetical protein Rhopal_007543-T1 [Rhodotorula paludigena]|uniref:Isochorismatase-like domain-containing protein n=1 Tax=Rhodotorula paludigena TaxID=86838 RepID=A0AAV5H154_9BASI|nr:hypothetical protein Rhopal_007543-T1 [Rhodotorula paludigena]
MPAAAYRFREKILRVPNVPVSASSKKSALLVIDVQGAYAPGAPVEITDVTQHNEVIKGLVQKYRQVDGEVIWILHHELEEDPVSYNAKDASGDFFDDLRPNAGEKVIIKHMPSSFHETDLQEYLESKGIKQIVLTGYMAQVCITSTTVYGFHLGFDVVIVRDAIGSHECLTPDGERLVTAAELVEGAVNLLHDGFGTVITAADVQA